MITVNLDNHASTPACKCLHGKLKVATRSLGGFYLFLIFRYYGRKFYLRGKQFPINILVGQNLFHAKMLYTRLDEIFLFLAAGFQTKNNSCQVSSFKSAPWANKCIFLPQQHQMRNSQAMLPWKHSKNTWSLEVVPAWHLLGAEYILWGYTWCIHQWHGPKNAGSGYQIRCLTVDTVLVCSQFPCYLFFFVWNQQQREWLRFL